MANVDFFSAFGYAWGENGAIDTWIDTQYKLGWASIGSVPPSVEQFNAVHHIADLKANWLYGQLKTAADAAGVTLAANDLSALVQILVATAPAASTTKKGLIEIATETEAKALSSALLAITPATLAAVLAEFRTGIPGATFAEVDALTEDEGPIIVTDMGGYLYTWTTSAYFEGYRNVLCGEMPPTFAPAPRAWEESITGGVWSESDPKQKRLIALYRERGHVVAVGSWAKGWGRIADLGSGDWKAPDMQDVFFRMAGTDADTANAMGVGMYQADALQNITGTLRLSTNIGGIQAGGTASGAFSDSGTARSQIINGSTGTSNDITFSAAGSPGARTSTETRAAAARVAAAVLV